MKTRFKFPPEARLRSERQFRAVYRRGRRVRAFPLRIVALERGSGQSRLGLSVGRKVGGAVTRARWKRAVREAFRLNRHLLRGAYDIVVSVNWEARFCGTQAVIDAFVGAVEKLNADSGPTEAR